VKAASGISQTSWAFEYQAIRLRLWKLVEETCKSVRVHVCLCVSRWTQYDKQIFWQYSSGSTPLTGMEAGLLTTTTSSSMCITVIGSEVTGTSCLQHTNRNQLNVALFRLRLHASHTRTWCTYVDVHAYTRIHTFVRTRDRRIEMPGSSRTSRQYTRGKYRRSTWIEANR